MSRRHNNTYLLSKNKLHPASMREIFAAQFITVVLVALTTTAPPLSSATPKQEPTPEHLTKRTAMSNIPTATLEVYRVALYDEASPLIVATWREVIEHISEYEGDDLFDGGERISITKTSMSAEAFAALPEWDGP